MAPYSNTISAATKFQAVVLLTAMFGWLLGCSVSVEDPSPAIPARHIAADRWPESVGRGATWAEFQTVQKKVHRDYLQRQREAYLWFAHSGNGTAGVPFILLRLFPELYPDIFGAPDEHLSQFGYVVDPEDPQRPLPLGLGWAPNADRSMNVVTLTCGACHIGYVRLEDRAVLPLVGGPNTRVDVRKWRHSFELAAQRIQKDGAYKTASKLNELIKSKPVDYFYAERTSLGGQADGAVEQRERLLFSNAAELILTTFVQRTLAGQVAVTKQKETSYSRRNAPPLDGGSPGQSDGSGDLIPKLLQFDLLHKEFGLTPSGADFDVALAKFKEKSFDELPMRKATVTDILSTWRQNEHPLAQIDGTVKSPFYRNIAAILAVVGDPRAVNVENAKVCADFLSELPPPAYPFQVDMQRAERGRVLFQLNCAVCHKPQNTVVYRARPSTKSMTWPTAGIGTDANRAEVLNEAGVALFVRYFRESVPADFVITSASGEKIRPRELPDDSIIIDRSRPEVQGYVTDALNGLWARGPYLHNGSVPTVRHLLVPSSRPKKFVRGSINFDQANIGWQWLDDRLEEIRKFDPQATVFRTRLDAASNLGHDRDLTVDLQGHIVREGWDEFDRTKSLKVRLDWSEPKHKYSLDDLLEYLKTL